MKSIDRVRAAAEAAGLPVDIVTMPATTRTAEDAATACGCTVDRIVKSMIFEAEETGELVLLLVSGRHNADLTHVQRKIGLTLKRADPTKVRDVTGFAIGGVSPIGHKSPIKAWIDTVLLGQETVWAAAGKPNAVFEAEPKALAKAAGAEALGMVSG
ncbi:MAG: YbaK/EbsC family protein [Alphaproteobacteria bacterium]